MSQTFMLCEKTSAAVLFLFKQKRNPNLSNLFFLQLAAFPLSVAKNQVVQPIPVLPGADR